ncbi:MAG: ATP-binding protein [Alphaproteobacteria bacterium]|jgi:thymidylate kinase|nr:ATP-binding protein [Alphaproteobacteria bacterium]
MCKIISISGSHGVGKTSLIDLIINNFSEHSEKIKFFKEFNSGLFAIGFALNGKAHDFDEVMFSQQKAFSLGYETLKYYLDRKSDKRLIITDRSCVDTYVYTDYFLKKHPEEFRKYSKLLEDMKTKSQEILREVNHVFLPPFKDFEVLEDRMSLNDRDIIWHNFQECFLSEKDAKCVILETNSTLERYDEILQHKEITPVIYSA